MACCYPVIIAGDLRCFTNQNCDKGDKKIIFSQSSRIVNVKSGPTPFAMATLHVTWVARQY